MNELLVFQDGPSVDTALEWAKYTDASDQCSPTRICGGIHPPADDIPERLIGSQLGPKAFKHPRDYFNGGLWRLRRPRGEEWPIPIGCRPSTPSTSE